MLASAHFWGGLVILALVILQILVRVVSARPNRRQPPGPLKWQCRRCSPCSTSCFWQFPQVAVAAYIADEFGDIHATVKPAFTVLIWLHAVPPEASISVPR